MPTGNESPRAAVILISGLPGAGKTTFVRQLAGIIALDHHESDAVRREIFRAPTYTFAESRIVFREMERRVARSLQAGRVAAADATNLREDHRARFHGLALRFDAALLCIRLVAPREVIQRRLLVPREGASQATMDVHDSMLASVEGSCRPALCVDTRYPLDPSLRLVSRILKESKGWTARLP